MADKKEIIEQSKQQADIIVNNSFIDGLSAQLKEKMKYGLTFPADYNPTNELMGAYLTLKDSTDKNGKPVLEVCSQSSVAFSLMKMVNAGLSMQKIQCYPIAYGGKLSIQPSVYGNITVARRYGLVDIEASPIYKGDTFIMKKINGATVIENHETSFENIDNENIIGAYAIATMADGTTKAEVMTMKMIEQAWKQGFGYKENGNGTHQKFTDQMCEKTVKNRLLKKIIRTHGEPTVIEAFNEMEKESGDDIVKEDVKYDISTHANSEPFEMPQETEVVTGEVEETIQDNIEVVDESEPEFMKG